MPKKEIIESYEDSENSEEMSPGAKKSKKDKDENKDNLIMKFFEEKGGALGRLHKTLRELNEKIK